MILTGSPAEVVTLAHISRTIPAPDIADRLKAPVEHDERARPQGLKRCFLKPRTTLSCCDPFWSLQRKPDPS